MLYTVRGLTEDSRGVTIRLRIISKHAPRVVKTRDGKEHKVADLVVGDRTGRVGLSLWDEMVDLVDEGDLVDIERGYVNSFKGRLRLNISRSGSVVKVDDPSFPEAQEINNRPWMGRFRGR